uniref:Uncharacterized protein n=1 Tax=Ditylum brightwellii TaxID=49249 RepID=A0A7S4SK40_9STRA
MRRSGSLSRIHSNASPCGVVLSIKRETSETSERIFNANSLSELCCADGFGLGCNEGFDLRCANGDSTELGCNDGTELELGCTFSFFFLVVRAWLTKSSESAPGLRLPVVTACD